MRRSSLHSRAVGRWILRLWMRVYQPKNIYIFTNWIHLQLSRSQVKLHRGGGGAAAWSGLRQNTIGGERWVYTPIARSYGSQELYAMSWTECLNAWTLQIRDCARLLATSIYSIMLTIRATSWAEPFSARNIQRFGAIVRITVYRL